MKHEDLTDKIIKVFYKVYNEGEIVGEYIADFIVDEKVIVEIKAINSLQRQMKVSC